MITDINAEFEKFEDDYGRFDDIENKMSMRPDLHAFILFDQLAPAKGDIISASEHDEFFLNVDVEEFKKHATPEIVRDLRRCGVMWSGEYESFSMFA